MNFAKIKSLVAIGLIFAAFLGCGDMESKHEDYLNGEKIYAGKLDSLTVYSGYERVKIVGQTNYLGYSNKCIVEWGDQSREFAITGTGNKTFEMIIDGLQERNYEFKVYTEDAEGNKSVIQTCTGKAMGAVFTESQMNRRIVEFNFVDGYFSALWADKAESEYVVYTDFSFETTDGSMQQIRIMPDDESTVLMGWKAGGKTEIQSYVLTGELGFDVVQLAVSEGSLPASSVFSISKANFAVVSLTNDTPGNSYGGKIPGMWDGVKGSDQGSRYHTGDGEGVPHTLTFDMGLIATIDRVEIVGREDHHNWNPRRIQFWGCENIDGKDTALPASDVGWEQEAQDKGWKLLIDQTLTDPHENMITFDKTKTENVRYIRIRVMEVVGPPSSGTGAYGCIQEISLWGEDIRPVE
ncbi:MAG: hypothetical protein LBQ60_16155 [Bacteroidales bacterium]|nr:hypothetical protein [Bacteroidales bacterium]